MNKELFEKWHQQRLITDASFERLQSFESSRLWSIHWELKLIMYAGVLLLTGGLGLLVYKNIDTIGHQAVVAFIGVICLVCFAYCERNKAPFSFRKAPATANVYFDYVLLLGCLSLLTFIGYLQFQYNAFGTSYQLATFIPAVLLFLCAYYFDNIGILSLSIANFAAWVGITVTPLNIFGSNDFNDVYLIYAALLFGLLLIVVSVFSERRKIKEHFAFTYENFGMNILFIATLAGMFHYDNTYYVWLLPLAALAFYFYQRALRLSSFYFIAMIILYTYVGAGYIVVRFVNVAQLILIYFIISAVLSVLLMVRLNQKLKRDDRIQ